MWMISWFYQSKRALERVSPQMHNTSEVARSAHNVKRRTGGNSRLLDGKADGQAFLVQPKVTSNYFSPGREGKLDTFAG